MKKCFIMLVTLLAVLGTSAQQFTIPDLITMLDMPQHTVDTLVKHKGYLLMQKDIDSASVLYSYSSVERPEGAPTVIRSLTFAEAAVGNLKSRLITYRTYSKEEYQQMIPYLLHHDYKATHQFDLGDAHHTIFENGQQSIRVIVRTIKLEKGEQYTSYEFELGK